MDAWISSQLSKLKERTFKSFRRDQETVSLWLVVTDKEIKSYYRKGYFLPKEEFFRGRTSSLKTQPWKHLRGCFLILKSLNSDNLRRRLQESIIALGLFKELWKFFRMQAWRRGQSKNPIGSSSTYLWRKNQSRWMTVKSLMAYL